MNVVMPCFILNDQILKSTELAVQAVGDNPLIIIDNASPMGGGYLRSIADIYIRNKENLGYAKACNQGIKLAKDKYVALISNDVVVAPNWREVALETFKDDTFSVHFRMIDYGVPFEYGNKTLYEGKERWCTAACFVMDKTKGLLFDEDFFNSYEDWDLFYRARKEFKTAYTDKSCFQHAHSLTQTFMPQREEATRKNREVFREKHGKYAEDLFKIMYPEQMIQDYRRGFDNET